MLARLLGLLKNNSELEQETVLPSSNDLEAIQQTQELNPDPSNIGSYNGPSNLIGFNYLKKKGEDDENLNPPRKFINLANLLRGKFGNG